MKFKNIDLSESLPDSLVNIEEKTRSNLFAWRGQFSPQLIEQILLNYSSQNDVVLDPFLGSGTVLHECALLGLRAYGCDINPAAVSFAKIYELTNRPKGDVLGALEEVGEIVSNYAIDLPLFSSSDISNFESEALEALTSARNTTVRTILLSLITGMDFGAKRLDAKRINNVWTTLRRSGPRILDSGLSGSPLVFWH